MIYNCKERFGYTYLWTSDKKMQSLLFAYCEGRSALWRMFLGWRKTSSKVDELLEIAKNF